MAGTETVVDPLDALDQWDLEDVRERIAKLEAERDAALSQHNRRIDALGVIEKALDIAKNGKPARKKSHRSGPDDEGPDDATRAIHAYLLKFGAQPPRQIKSSTGLHHMTVKRTLKDQRYFARELDGNFRARGSRPI